VIFFYKNYKKHYRGGTTLPLSTTKKIAALRIGERSATFFHKKDFKIKNHRKEDSKT